MKHFAAIAIAGLVAIAPGARVDAYSASLFAVCGLDPNGDNYLALRTGPGSGHAKLQELGPGTKVWDWERRGNWYRVTVDTVNGREGWVYAGYLCLLEGH